MRNRAYLSTKVFKIFFVMKTREGAYLPYLSIYKFLGQIWNNRNLFRTQFSQLALQKSIGIECPNHLRPLPNSQISKFSTQIAKFIRYFFGLLPKLYENCHNDKIPK